MSTWTNDCQARLPPKASICSAASSPWPPPSHLTTWHTGVVWGLKVILLYFIIVKGGPGYPPCRAARLGRSLPRRAWVWCWNSGIRVPRSGTSVACWVGSSRSIHSNPYDLASWSDTWSCSWIFSLPWIHSCGHSMQRSVFTLGEVPLSSLDNPMRLVYMVDSGLHHRSPCKCA